MERVDILSTRSRRGRRAGRALLAAVLGAAAVTMTGAHASDEVGAGIATGEVACTRLRSRIELFSRVFYGDGWRGVVARVASDGDCRVPGALIMGAARLTGDGIECGEDPRKPFTGYFAHTAGGVHLVAGFLGSCVVDGVERSSRFEVNGAVVAGRFGGYLLPTGDWPL